MKLYYHPFSTNCFHVLALADYLGIELERIVTDPFKGETRTPEYLKYNPNAKVPLLVDGDFGLWESNAIMQYLANQVETPLWPKDEKIRADISRWQFWRQAHWENACEILLWEKLVKGMAQQGEADPVEVKKGEAGVEHFGAVLNQSLEGKTYLLGDRLTLADFAIAAPLYYQDICPLPVKDFKHVQAWYDRIAQLEAWQKNLPQFKG